MTFLGTMGYCTHYGYKHGNVEKLLAPLDGDKHFCGHEAGYEQYPKMYITDFGFSTPSKIFAAGVCVKKCPQVGDKTLDCKATGSVANCNDPKIISAIYNTKDVLDYCFPASIKDLPASF